MMLRELLRREELQNGLCSAQVDVVISASKLRYYNVFYLSEVGSEEILHAFRDSETGRPGNMSGDIYNVMS